jgi:putative PEP-CTERM system TPR-repeat lipoprotein
VTDKTSNTKARRIAVLAAALLASSTIAGPALADVPPMSAAQNNASVEKMLADAQKAVKAGNIRAALITLKNAVSVAPRDGNARTQLGVVLMRMGDDAGAERELRQARKDGAPENLVLPPLFDVMLSRNENQVLLDQFPEPGADSNKSTASDIFKARALALQNLNKKPEALAAMDHSLALRRDWSGLLTRARLSFQQADEPTAMKFADEAIAKADSPDPMLSKVGMLLSVNKSAEALELANQLLAKYPGNFQGRFARVEAYINLKRDSEAKAEVDALLVKIPNANLGLYYRALLLARAGDYKGAWNYAQNLPGDFRDSSPRISMMIAQMAVQSGNTETGASILNRILLKTPDLAVARLRLAAIRMQQNNPEAALAVLQPIKDSTSPLVIELLSNVYLKLQRSEDALNAFRKLDAATKNRADVKRNLGILEVRTGNIDQGIKDLSQAAAKSPTDLSVVYPLINALVRQKRFAEALAISDRVGKDPSKQTISLIYRGGILFSQHDNAGAEAAFNKAVASDPKSTAALLARAEMMAVTQRQAEALRDYRAIVSLDGKNVSALLQIAQIAQRQGDDRTARTSLNQAITAAPDNMAPRFALINYLNSQKKLPEALTATGELLRLQPNNLDGLALLGRIQLAQGQQKEAVATYRRLVSLTPTAAGPQVLLANALSISGDRAGAVRALETAVKLSPNSAEVKGVQINFQIKQGNTDGAVAAARSFQAANPGSAADLLLADTLNKAQHRDDAIAVLSKSLSDRPNSVVLLQLARLHLQANDPTGAASLMSTWLAKNPADMGVRVEYANILMQQQSNAQAIAQFQMVLRQDPNNVVVLNNLGWMLQTSDPKRALSMLTLAQKIAPNSPDIADTLGWVKVQLKDVAGGLALLNKAHAASPQDGEITYHLAVALDASGQRGPARQLLKTLLASGTKFTDLPAANKLAADWR